MTDKYTRRFLCYIRWFLYLAGILATIKDHGHVAFFLFFFATILLKDKAPNYFLLMRRYKWYFFSSMIYYVFVFAYVVSKSGEVFDHGMLFVLFILLPFIPEIVYIELADYKGKL